jgi:hypothetical protein
MQALQVALTYTIVAVISIIAFFAGQVTLYSPGITNE